MAKKITPDELSEAVRKELTEYARLSTEDMKDAVKDAAKTVQSEIKANAPARTGRYAKSWSVKATKETSNTLEMTVYSRNRYQLTHLLEHGHAKRGGGRVAAIPHIAPAEEAGEKQLTEEIMRSLGNE
jgi:hypothetical protein